MNSNLAISIALMALTGIIDGQAFNQVSKIWQQDGFQSQFLYLAKTMIIFAIGFITYIAATFFLHREGLTNPLSITLIWFISTIISLAIISGNFFDLSAIDKIISITAIISIGLLYYRGIA